MKYNPSPCTRTVLLPGGLSTLLLCALVLISGLASPRLAAQPDTNTDKFVIRNLGTIANTGDLEYAPTITADGKTLFFVSDRPGGIGGHDFWVTTKQKRLDTIFSTPINLDRPINTELNEGVASIAADGQTIFFTGCNRPDGLGDCDLYEAELDGNKWINVRNVSEINSSSWDSQPSISSDGKTIYFVSNRPGALGGEGDRDIYMSRLQSDGKWSPPVNVGPPINTTDREDSPFLIAGSGAIYFASAGHGGFGGLDFFVAKKQTDGTWGTPENLGEPYNTSRDERFLALPAAGDIIYFSSERNDLPNAGKLDIFMGILPPRTVAILIKGRVFDQCTGNNLPADMVFINEATGDTLYSARTNPTSGEFSFVINAEGAMKIKVLGTTPGYPAISDNIDVPVVKEYTEIVRNYPLGVQPTISAIVGISDYVGNLPATTPEKYRNFRGLLIEENLVKELYPVLTYVFFDSGSATIPDRYILFKDPSETVNFNDTTIPGGTLQKYYHVLNIVGYRMRQNPGAKIEIVGCNSERTELNEVIAVSEQRGKVVYDYLRNIWQIDAGRIKLLPARGFPQFKSNPKDPLGIVENQRTEINVVDPVDAGWEIAKPIVQRDFRRTPQPDSMIFEMKNGISDDFVARRAIEIKRGGQIWYVMTNVGVKDPMSPGFFWTRTNTEDANAIPNDETPYTAQLVVYSRDGKECRSNVVEVPVEIIFDEEKKRERLFDRLIDRYSLVLFKFDSPDAGPLNERILREYIYSDIRQGAQIEVIGHTDVVGLEDRNLKLSKDRAATVTNGIRSKVKSSLYSKLEGTGVGEESPLYPNDLPEGRFYNRTVTMVVVTPNSAAQ